MGWTEPFAQKKVHHQARQERRPRRRQGARRPGQAGQLQERRHVRHAVPARVASVCVPQGPVREVQGHHHRPKSLEEFNALLEEVRIQVRPGAARHAGPEPAPDLGPDDLRLRRHPVQPRRHEGHLRPGAGHQGAAVDGRPADQGPVRLQLQGADRPALGLPAGQDGHGLGFVRRVAAVAQADPAAGRRRASSASC